MLSAYHIGSHDTINETYRKIFRWADNHGYKCGNSSIETIRDGLHMDHPEIQRLRDGDFRGHCKMILAV